MPYISSMDATYHDAQDLINALQNPAPEIPLVKLRNVHKEALKTLSEIIRKANPPSSTSKDASQGGRPKESPRSEPERKPNKNGTAIKSNHQYRTSDGDYRRDTPRLTPTSEPSKITDKFSSQSKARI